MMHDCKSSWSSEIEMMHDYDDYKSSAPTIVPTITTITTISGKNVSDCACGIPD